MNSRSDNLLLVFFICFSAAMSVAILTSPRTAVSGDKTVLGKSELDLEELAAQLVKTYGDEAVRAAADLTVLVHQRLTKPAAALGPEANAILEALRPTDDDDGLYYDPGDDPDGSFTCYGRVWKNDVRRWTDEELAEYDRLMPKGDVLRGLLVSDFRVMEELDRRRARAESPEESDGP